MDFNDLQPGQQRREELERATGQAQWFLILTGSGSHATPWQEAEWSAALARTWEDGDKRLLPIVFGEGEPPPFLRNWVALRVATGTHASTWTGQVMDVLRNLRKEAVHPSARGRAERQERLEEIEGTVEALRRRQADAPPIQTDSSQ